MPQKTDCSKSHGKGETDEHYALVYLANLYFEAASHHKTLPAAKDPISHHFVCPCHPFKVLPTLKEPADQLCLCSLSRCARNTFEHAISCKGTVLLNATKMKIFFGIM